MAWVQIELDGTLSEFPIGSIIGYGGGDNATGINVYFEGVPNDYSPERYDYQPANPAIYDPNGFIPIPQPEPSESDFV